MKRCHAAEIATQAGGRCAVSAAQCHGGDGAPPSSKIIVLAAAILLGRSLAADANSLAPPPAAAPAAASFAAFRLIGDWNIFDPNRVGRKNSEPPPPAGDTISLVGTMQYEKGLFAFFDSPDSSYRKALRVGDAIAQFTVTRILADGVELTRDSKRLSLTIGQQLHRPEGGQWTVTAAPRVDRAPAANNAPAIPADASDVLRRLMEQRQKQLKQ
jgi:hypothetical protein